MRIRLWLTVGIALVIALGAIGFAARRQLGPQYKVIAILPRADGVREGAPVTFRGLDIGYLERLSIDKGRVVAELRIRRGDAIIRKQDTLRTQTMGLMGDKRLDFVPGDNSAPIVTPADTIVALIPLGPIQR